MGTCHKTFKMVRWWLDLAIFHLALLPSLLGCLASMRTRPRLILCMCSRTYLCALTLLITVPLPKPSLQGAQCASVRRTARSIDDWPAPHMHF